MNKILSEISAGELLDKISILEIKLNEIRDETLLTEVRKEHDILNKTKNKNINFSKEVEILYNSLKSNNKEVWLLIDEYRNCIKKSDLSSKFIKLSMNIYMRNEKRFIIKSKINKILGSDINEIKQPTVCDKQNEEF
jgi:hypothetical protein